MTFWTLTSLTPKRKLTKARLKPHFKLLFFSYLLTLSLFTPLFTSIIFPQLKIFDFPSLPRHKLRFISTFVFRQKSYHSLVCSASRPNEIAFATLIGDLSRLKEVLIRVGIYFYLNNLLFFTPPIFTL